MDRTMSSTENGEISLVCYKFMHAHTHTQLYILTESRLYNFYYNANLPSEDCYSISLDCHNIFTVYELLIVCYLHKSNMVHMSKYFLILSICVGKWV